MKLFTTRRVLVSLILYSVLILVISEFRLFKSNSQTVQQEVSPLFSVTEMCASKIEPAAKKIFEKRADDFVATTFQVKFEGGSSFVRINCDHGLCFTRYKMSGRDPQAFQEAGKKVFYAIYEQIWNVGKPLCVYQPLESKITAPTVLDPGSVMTAPNTFGLSAIAFLLMLLLVFLSKRLLP